MLTCGSFFSGAGLLDDGLRQAGWDHRWLCEWDEWRRARLIDRFPDARIHDDVRHIGADNAEPVVLTAGGFPCKGASSAGKRNGFDHPETVLWREMRRAIGELEPRYVLIENVANLLSLHDGAVWGEVLGDLAALGFDAVWDCLPAAAVGAPHRRDRVFAIATHPDRVARAQGQPLEGRRGQVDRPGAVERAQRLHGAPEAPADAECERGERRREPGDVAAEGRGAQGEARQRQRRGDAALDRGAVASDSGDGGREERPPVDGSEPTIAARHAERPGVQVEWGAYEAAVRRWEAVVGPAPEPLVRRLDDGDVAVQRVRRGVDRPRLSAQGDGVQVQVGYLIGLHIAGLEQEGRLTDAA